MEVIEHGRIKLPIEATSMRELINAGGYDLINPRIYRKKIKPIYLTYGCCGSFVEVGIVEVNCFGEENVSYYDLIYKLNPVDFQIFLAAGQFYTSSSWKIVSLHGSFKENGFFLLPFIGRNLEGKKVLDLRSPFFSQEELKEVRFLIF